MKLKFQDEINKIENCPNTNEDGEIKLYRFVSSIPLSNNTFEPHAKIHKPKFNNICIAWGLSTYNTLDNAVQALKNLPKKRRNSFCGIAVAIIDNSDGVKYLSRSNGHYTYFPKDKLDLLTKFALVKDYDKK